MVYSDGEKSDVEMVSSINEDISAEDMCHVPPPSLVPRLHCLFFKKLDHVNPSIPLMVLDERKEALDSILKDVISIRTELLRLLTKLLCGDRCAAEFLLMNLISKV